MKTEVVACVDITHVIMIEAKTIEAKIVLARYVDKDNIPKMPQDNRTEKHDNVNSWYGSPKAESKYSIEYITDIINVIKIFEKPREHNDFLIITTGTDTPIQIENEHFRFLLAPRIESD